MVNDSEQWCPAHDLSHLTPAAAEAAVLPDAERIERIRADRWIGYGRAKVALAKLEELLAWPRRQRMQNLLIIGPTNNGKSMIIERFRRDHLPYPSEDGSREVMRVVVMQMPSDPSVRRFYAMLLHAMNLPMLHRRNVAELEVAALRLMQKVQVRMLVIDELHNMLAGGQALRGEFLNILRFLGNELRIPIIGVGTEDAYRAIRSDDQLENRFRPLVLPRWEPGDEVMSLLASFAASFPLRRPSQICTPEMATYILTRTEGTIGEMATLLTRAAIVAIESREEAINSRTLSLADYDSPTERRRTFEREIA
jgi:hypothetical protein